MMSSVTNASGSRSSATAIAASALVGVHHREALRLELHTNQLRRFVVALDHERGARARRAPRTCAVAVGTRRLEREVSPTFASESRR